MHPIVGQMIQYIGGRLGAVAGSAVIIGGFFVIVGVTPWQFVARLAIEPPAWAQAGWFRLAILMLGLVVIWASLNFNRWSNKQKAIDELAVDISWAITNLLNRGMGPEGRDDRWMAKWQDDFTKWCDRITQKLSNRTFFTYADQLHFEYLGFVNPIEMSTIPKFNHLLSMLRLKFERLRDIINWTQQRRW